MIRIDRIKDFSGSLKCLFLDHNTLSKEDVKEIYTDKLRGLQDQGGVLIATCLRIEIYTTESIKLNKDFQYCEGKIATKRLFSLLCGLESEILGEKEILTQFKSSLEDSIKEEKINERDYYAFRDILKECEKIRKDNDFFEEDNYSTIGFKITSKFLKENNKKDPNIMIIGGGYMTESFLKEIDMEYLKIYWYNRNTKRIKKIAKKLNIPEDKITFLQYGDIKKRINQMDIIFAGIGNSPNIIKDQDLKKNNCIAIDVSYPPAIEPTNKIKLINLYSKNFIYYSDKEKEFDLKVKIKRRIIDKINHILK